MTRRHQVKKPPLTSAEYALMLAAERGDLRAKKRPTGDEFAAVNYLVIEKLLVPDESGRLVMTPAGAERLAQERAARTPKPPKPRPTHTQPSMFDAA